MDQHPTPDLSPELANRIRLVRRDMGGMLFHFTRASTEKILNVVRPNHTIGFSGTAGGVLKKILYEGELRGTSKWTYGHDCVCFTEAPIQEFNAIFQLVELASSEQERPRYEPYGVAVSKRWLFENGGRPVIYDTLGAFASYPAHFQYRFVPYDPAAGIDFTWEREWRVPTSRLVLDPKQTLAVLPTSDEAFSLVYELAEIEADYDKDGSPMGVYHVAKWLAVSLDVFGFRNA
jgi:hypothetical protein